MTKKTVSESSNAFICTMCDYTTCRGSQYDRHLLTRKHEIRKNTKVLVRESCEKVPKSSASLSCSCGKTYKHSSSLWNHQQKCTLSNNNPVVIDKAFPYLSTMEI